MPPELGTFAEGFRSIVGESGRSDAYEPYRPVGPLTLILGQLLPKLVLIDHRSSHHAGPSGYGRLAHFVDCVVIPERELRFPPWRVRRFFAKRGGAAYSTTSFSKEVSVLRQMIGARRGIAHFLNAENDFLYTGCWSRQLRWSTIGTFHFPPAAFGQVFPKPKALRRLNAAICVSTSQVPAVTELLGHERVSFIPLGVDIEFFSPAPESGDERLCLFVGTHLRDFETLYGVAVQLARRNAGAKIVVIVPERYASAVRPHPLIEIHAGVSDADLRAWYRRAALLLLPIKDATATSAILEAMACGTPIVTNEIGGTRDYISRDLGFLCPVGDVHAMTTAAIQLLDDRPLNARMREAARRRATGFSWPIVAEAIVRVYAAASLGQGLPTGVRKLGAL